MKRACFILLMLALAGFALAQNQPLTVTSPNGGEVWTTGSTHSITWTQLNLSGTVNILLVGQYSPAPTVVFITQGIPIADGQFEWLIPETIPTADSYRVRVAQNSSTGTYVMDLSDGYFTITGSTDPPPPQTYIAVTAPNGGEQWSIGSTQNITWSFGNLEGDVRITLVQGANMPQIVVAETTPIAAGTFTWTVPDFIPTGQYKVHVQWLGIPAVYIGDMSDEFFSIVNDTPPPPQVLTLTAPNGGETWVAGTMHPITWTYDGNGGSVMIQLMGGPEMAPIVIIANNVPALPGIFHWMIPAGQMPGEAYQVQINLINADGTFISDISDAPFTIIGNTPPPPGPLTLLTPNGGEVWAIGSTQTITWTQQNLTGALQVWLMGPPANTLIAHNVPIESGVLTWTVPPSVVPGAHFRVKIFRCCTDGTFVSDLSDAEFTITGNVNPPQPITVTSPNGGEIWMAGTMSPITWNYTGNGGSVIIQLMGGPEMTPMVIIAQNIPANAGVFNWNIPPYQTPGEAYQVQISLLDPSGVFIGDISDAPFTIVQNYPPPQGITVTSPNGGETWVAGTMHPITWNFNDLAGEVYIGLLAENMKSITILAPAVPITDQQYFWTIPAEIMPGRYMIQVVWITDMAVYIGDISDDYFNIVNSDPPPPQFVTLVSPNGGEVLTIGETFPINWISMMPEGFVTLSLLGVNDPTAFNMIIAENIPAAQMIFPWNIPDNIPAGSNYQLLILQVLADGSTSSDASDSPFSIILGEEPPPQSVVVTTPNGGEQWLKGTWQDITWTDTDLSGNVRIALIYGQQAPYRRLVIARNAPNTGTFHWRVPYRLPAGDFYKIVVKHVNGASDTSDGYFSLLAPNYNLKATPNPTVQSTSISFDMETPATATVRIYNVKGQCVRTLITAQTLSGSQSIHWDGNDEQGRKVSAGIYFARIAAPKFNLSQKIIMLK